MTLDLTIVLAIDEQHLEELQLAWKTWEKNCPEIQKYPIILFCDSADPLSKWQEKLNFIHHDSLELITWDLPSESQREKMLSSFVFGVAEHVKTKWYLKIDTDAVAYTPTSLFQPEWFNVDQDGQVPVYIAQPWNFSKPAYVIDQLNYWATKIPELASLPAIQNSYPDDATRVIHDRMISWYFFANTQWTKQMSELCTEKAMPVPSQDTFLWYCAELRGDPIRLIDFTEIGWKHIPSSKLSSTCKEIINE